MLTALALFALAADPPLTVALEPVSGGTADAPVLDRLLAAAATELDVRFVPRADASAVISPLLEPLTDGRVRVVLGLRKAGVTDRVGFEQTAGRFGQKGAAVMLRAAVDRLKTMEAPPPPPPLPAAAEPAAEPVNDKPFDHGRIRFGASAGAGAFFPGPMFATGAEGRVGWQFKPWLGLYLAGGGRAGFLIGGGFDASTTTVTQNVGSASWWYLTALAELMAGDVIFVAAGPGLARGSWAFISQSGGTLGGAQSVNVQGGWMPALDFKVGFGFGGPNKETGRRHQFTLAFDAMMVIAPGGASASQSAGMNGVNQRVAENGAAIGFVPMLMLGYDAR